MISRKKNIWFSFDVKNLISNYVFYNIFFLQGMDGSTVYYENNNNYPKNNKPGYANRKESTDSGISDFSSVSSRKTSAISTSSIGSNLNEDKILEDVKEELPPMEVCV